MGVQDDFDLWECELQGLLPPSSDPYEDGAPDLSAAPSGSEDASSTGSSERQEESADDSTGRRPGGRSLLLAFALVAAGCGLVCYLGGWALAVIVLLLCAFILLLWRIGW